MPISFVPGKQHSKSVRKRHAFGVCLLWHKNGKTFLFSKSLWQNLHAGRGVLLTTSNFTKTTAIYAGIIKWVGFSYVCCVLWCCLCAVAGKGGKVAGKERCHFVRSPCYATHKHAPCTGTRTLGEGICFGKIVFG
ncbi:MAG: hypothetical protein OXM61_16720 [Candidatus Poribacteria bacterium]|nr:hypothetical protein [Candidatus Poribacteria bacterium]